MTIKKSTTQVARWDEELAKRAKIAAGTAESASSGSKSIRVQGGQFIVNDNPIGNTISVIVLGFVLENAWYPEAYDPDNIVPPACFAFGDNAKTMAPVEEDVQDKQSDLCKSCALGGDDAWGSANQGKGKACKNIRKLLVMTEDDLENLDEAELRVLKVPVTSTGAWDGYVKTLGVAGKPPLAVLTRITVTIDPKTQFKLSFKVEGEVDGDIIGDIIAKADASISALSVPYSAREEEEGPPIRSSKSKATKKPATRRK